MKRHQACVRAAGTMAPLESFQSRSFRFSLEIQALSQDRSSRASAPTHPESVSPRRNCDRIKSGGGKSCALEAGPCRQTGDCTSRGPRMPLLASPGARRPTETGTRSRASARRKRSDHCDPDSFSPKAACHICRASHGGRARRGFGSARHFSRRVLTTKSLLLASGFLLLTFLLASGFKLLTCFLASGFELLT